MNTSHIFTIPAEIKSRNRTLSYLLHVPSDYATSPRKRYPLMLFLHGAGERGSDVKKVAKHGPPREVRRGADLPFIIISPQCPTNTWWTAHLDVLTALLDDVMSRYRVNGRRVYLTGLSMGGYGTWALAALHPERFAAIAPVCGGGDPKTAPQLRDMPTWVFHGAKDEIVPISESQKMVDALFAVDNPARFTVYPTLKHDSWTRTYANPELYHWMLQHLLPRE